MIQLRVYNDPDKTSQHWLDLYDTEPIKLTLSIEDITNADATSTYSKAFKVPGTRHNAEFFKNSFDVDGTLFDVTVKKPAQILVDGAEFKQGHVRLQKVFLNTDLDRYDYELVFLGETRDFSSIIGDRKLCELNLSELVGGHRTDPLFPTQFTAMDAVRSWGAYPSEYAWNFTSNSLVAQTPTQTSGLHNGDIIYPLVDHGNTYDETGSVEQSRIALGGTDNFTSNDFFFNRLKPMIRARRILDQIFADANYTWSSNFLDSDLFNQIYVSAFGNEAYPEWDSGASSANSNGIAHGDNLTNTQYAEDDLYFPNNWINPGAPTYGLATFITSGGPRTVYRVPTNYSVGSDYVVSASCFYQGHQRDDSPAPGSFPADIPIDGRLVFRNYTQGVDLNVVSNWGNGDGSTLVINPTVLTGPFTQGDHIGIYVQTLDSTDQSAITNVQFDVLEAPGEFNPAASLECQYKQIDFVKDILTAFRLVLSPDPNNPKNFIIEPWQTYINSGDLYDWSKKLVENQDVQVEPVFFSQSDVINFKFQPGSDWGNIYHQQAYQEPYGYLEFSSNNDLLKGTREVKLTGIAPTVLLPIEHGNGTSQDYILPQLHTHSAGDQGTEHRPIKTKTRLVFYNGLQPVGGPSSHYWNLNDSVGNEGNDKWSYYPLVSPYQSWPITSDTLNLNWSNDIQYWGTLPGYNLNGSTLYDNYWSRYISSLYNKYARRVTAKFVLNNIDLNKFSFDDTIFVNGTYYTPEKIIDVEVGAYTEVQVQLLTANDYKPSLFVQPLIGTTGQGYAPPCGDGLGYMTITSDGSAQFTWSLNNGMQGQTQFLSTDTPPFSWDITGLAPGAYLVDITDAVGRYTQIEVVVPAGGVPPTAPPLTSDCTSCAACDGTITVQPTGGVAPYTYHWTDAPNLNTDYRTGLCAGTYSYYVTDATGCSSIIYTANINCPPNPLYVYEAREYNAECNALSSQPIIVSSVGQITVGTSDAYKLDVYPGCYAITATSTATPVATVISSSPDCATCLGSETGYQDWYLFTYSGYVNNLNQGWMPYSDISNAGPLYAFLTGTFYLDNLQNYYLGTPAQTGVTQDLSTAFDYMLDKAGDPAVGDVRYLPLMEGFNWSDPSTQSPTVNVANLEEYPNPGFQQWYVAVKGTLFNQFFTPAGGSYDDTAYFGPKMWYANTNQEYTHSSSLNSDLWEYSKSFSLNGQAYVLLVNIVDYSYTGITDTVVPTYLKFDDVPVSNISWKVESCTTPGIYQYISNSSGPSVTAGLVVELDEGGCYTVLEQSTQAINATAIAVYDNCASCEGITSFNYDIIWCDDSQSSVASSSFNNLSPGSVMKLETGECVYISGTSVNPPFYTLDDSQIYQSCATCPGLCYSYDLSNYSQVPGNNLTVAYTSCVSGQLSEIVVPPDSDYYVCSTTVPYRVSGSNSYAITSSETIC